MVKVSVILPVFNKEDYLERCILSIQKQTFRDYELVIVNDGSTDNSKAIIERLTHHFENIKTFHFQENKGVSAARNHGINHAEGEYLYFVDADDYISPVTIDILLKTIGNEEVLIGTISNPKTNVLNDYPEEFHSYEYKASERVKAFRRLSVTNTIWRANFVKENALRFDERVKIYPDLTFLIPGIQRAKKVLSIRMPLYIRGECYDPIEQPRLRLLPRKQKVPDFLLCQQILRTEYDLDMEVIIYLDDLFVKYYYKVISSEILRDRVLLSKWFNDIRDCSRRLQPLSIKKCGFFN